MVFKPLNLARQSFVKTFTHGYAQSLVAASQSSSASQNTSFHTLSTNVAGLFNKTGPPTQLQNAAQQPSSTLSTGAGPGAKASHPEHTGSDVGLAAYYAAWQRHRKSEEKDLHQFQFAKRIGWKAPTTIPEPHSRRKEQAKAGDEHERPRKATLTRSYSTSVVDGIQLVQNRPSIEAATGPSPIASAKQDADETSGQSAIKADSFSPREEVQRSPSPTLVDSSSSTTAQVPSTSPAQLSEVTSVSESEIYTENLTRLAERQQYAEIPAVFEAMLVAGIKPSTSAYNALMLSAINLPRGKHHVASKVLDVYSDMLSRKVLPDTSSYAILIELLAARSMDVLAMKQELVERRTRYGGLGQDSKFLMRSDETESQILAEDDSLSVAIKLFDTAAAVTTHHVLPAETYRLLISACAETARVGDMVRIYADMESNGVVPPAAIFAPMIEAFGNIGDLRSSVECYNEYKTWAVADDRGEASIVRKDEDVYAAVVKAYALCGRTSRGLKFLGKIEDMLDGSDRLPLIRDAVALQSLHPQWLSQDRHSEALNHALENLSDDGRLQALSAICTDAANKNISPAALQAWNSLMKQPTQGFASEAAMALLAMHIRKDDMAAAHDIWQNLKVQKPTIAVVEPATIYALASISRGHAKRGLLESRQLFAYLRDIHSDLGSRSECVDRIDEAIELLGSYMLKMNTLPASDAGIQMIHMMLENRSLITPVIEHILIGFGPGEIASLAASDTLVLMQVQAGLLIKGAQLDVAHAARFAYLYELVLSSGVTVDARTSRLVQDALTKLNRPDLLMRWQNPRLTPNTTPMVPGTPATPFTTASPTFDDNYDPHGSSTDYKGSSIIAEELEKSQGSHAQHLQNALAKFRNMRRAGRHPRYATYSKLISAAVKDIQPNASPAAKAQQLSVAEDIFNMAKQDVPLMAENRVVRNGWVSIFDAMVGACLTVGRRDLAGGFHQDLLSVGATPSANTFGLYITTMKESTKTFDEATEAVKIFHQAQNEGVEPSSFLYNALIGKLGKARRIDDCLFYFAEMRKLGIRPTSVTYGTIVNALCRVSDDSFAEDLFDEMESMANYKPRPAPYNCVMQYFLTTKRDRSKVLSYYNRMKANNIPPTMHTYKLLIDTHATLEPVDLSAAETVIDEIRATGLSPEPVHYAALIHAKGCVLHDMPAARELFDAVVADPRVPAAACLHQALFESYVANHDVAATEPLLDTMKKHGVSLTAYISNTLIHGWATAGDIAKSRSIFDALGRENREPSTYEAMTRAYLAAEERGNAMKVVGEALRRGYPSAVANKICELVGGSAAVTGGLS